MVVWCLESREEGEKCKEDKKNKIENKNACKIYVWVSSLLVRVQKSI